MSEGDNNLSFSSNITEIVHTTSSNNQSSLNSVYDDLLLLQDHEAGHSRSAMPFYVLFHTLLKLQTESH